FQGVRSFEGLRWALYSEWYCITGQNAAIAAARKYNSAVGISPLKPPMSHPQNGMPEMPADRPARIEWRKASHVEFSSPAQCSGARCDPVNPARLNVIASRLLLAKS